MSREILYRGKRTKNGAWIEGFYSEVNLNQEMLPVIITSGRDSMCSIPEFIDPATVGQFTGLTDKNGVKIFEGDIVRFAEWAKGEFCWVGIVIYKYCSFIVKGEANKECGGTFEVPLSRIPSERIEVIGNIHDSARNIGKKECSVQEEE